MSFRSSLSQSTGVELPSTNIDPLYAEEGAATYLGGEDRPIARRTLQRWRHEGVGPAWIRVGRLIRYRKSALDAFLLAHESQRAEVE